MRKWMPAAIGFLLGWSARGEPALTIGEYMVVRCGSGTGAPMQEPGSSSTYCLDRSPVFDQRDISSATLRESSKNGPYILVTLRDPVARRFRGITGNAIGNKIATILNGRLLSAAMILAPVQQSMIYGLTLPEARSVIDALNHGRVAQAAPVPPARGSNDTSEPDSRGIYRPGGDVSLPWLIQRQEPEYTAAARAAGIHGSVVLEIIVRADGTTDVAHVLHSLDPGLDAKAIECARAWRFKPAQKDGMPVAVRTPIVIIFHL